MVYKIKEEAYQQTQFVSSRIYGRGGSSKQMQALANNTNSGNWVKIMKYIAPSSSSLPSCEKYLLRMLLSITLLSFYYCYIFITKWMGGGKPPLLCLNLPHHPSRKERGSTCSTLSHQTLWNASLWSPQEFSGSQGHLQENFRLYTDLPTFTGGGNAVHFKAFSQVCRLIRESPLASAITRKLRTWWEQYYPSLN